MIKISEYRKMNGISQKSLAEKLGVSAGNLCEWEKGRIEPSISTLIKISELLEISVDELIGKDDNLTVKKEDNSKRFLYYFNLLDKENQNHILEIMKTMTKN